LEDETVKKANKSECGGLAVARNVLAYESRSSSSFTAKIKKAKITKEWVPPEKDQTRRQSIANHHHQVH
jgi:hypothetical protein